MVIIVMIIVKIVFFQMMILDIMVWDLFMNMKMGILLLFLILCIKKNYGNYKSNLKHKLLIEIS
jgi:hypothetical protein